MLKSSIIILSLCVLHISSTEDFVRTKPTESWMHEKDADEFTVECYRLGRIGIRFPKLIQRIKRFYTVSKTTPFTHPKKPPPPSCSCIKRFYELIKHMCHPPRPDYPDQTANLSTLNPQAIWIFGDNDEIAINRPESQRYNVTFMLEDCCATTSNQCDCFFRFGEANTPFAGICEAVLLHQHEYEAAVAECVSEITGSGLN